MSSTKTTTMVVTKASTAIASLPLMMWINDTFFKLCRVKGSSMEPTLHDGDIVIVRASDGFWQKWTRQTKQVDQVLDDNANERDDLDARTQYHQRRMDGFYDMLTDENFEGGDDDNIRWDMERRRVLQYEGEYCNVNPTPGLWLRKPLIPTIGDIVVFQDPMTYGRSSSSWNIKRVIGLGGQTVLVPFDRPKDESPHQEDGGSVQDGQSAQKQEQHHQHRFQSLDEYRSGLKIATTKVPPYSLWVEGDNRDRSIDSRRRGRRWGTNSDDLHEVEGHGPVSKKLLVGVAEYCIWPPWRVGKLSKQVPSINGQPDGRPRSFWAY